MGFYWRSRLYMQSGKSRRSIVQYLTRYYSFTTREIATLISNCQCEAMQTLHWIKEMKGNCRLLWEQINLLLLQGNTYCCCIGHLENLYGWQSKLSKYDHPLKFSKLHSIWYIYNNFLKVNTTKAPFKVSNSGFAYQ